jgi:hypothetical protein
MSCFGPHIFLETPMISMGTGSGSVPEKTVHATAFIPGFTSANFMIWTGPALGRGGTGSAEYRGNAIAATNSIAVKEDFMEVITPAAFIVLLDGNPTVLLS